MADVYQLALLLTLKDAASGGLQQFQARLLAAGKDGEKYAKSLEHIRSEMNKGVAMTGLGVGGMALMGKGVQVAGDFQASMTELRASFSQLGKDGKVNMAALGADMQKAEAVGMRLGNALPGTTEDFVQMMQVLKQNGLATETILNGAADAVGNLAVATKSVPREIAADFAQFGNLFKLRSQDFAPAADVFSRIYSSTGQTSTELVEAAKYFQGRAGTSLGIGGLKDAEQMTRIFGLLGKKGMRGSMAGMGLTNFFTEYNTHRDKLEDLTKATGIKLDFFDTRGKFVGMDKVIEQMKQFDKLSEKDRSSWMTEIFGVLGQGVGNILVDANAWKQFNIEQDKTISLAQKNAEVAKNFNNQLEALTGSAKNLVVTGFGPLLPMLTSGTESANKFVGAIIDFGRANPALTSTIAKFALMGTTAVTLVGAFKTGSNAFQLMRFASNFSSEERVTGFFKKLKENVDNSSPSLINGAQNVVSSTEKTSTAVTKGSKAVIAATESRSASVKKGFAAYVAADKAIAASVASTSRHIVDAEKKMGRFGSAYQSLASSGAVRLGVQIGVVMVAEAAVSSLISHIMEGRALSANVKLNFTEIQAQYDEMLLSGELYRGPGYKSGSIDASTRPAIETILDGGRLMRKLHPERTGPDDSYFKQITGANFWEDLVYSSPYGSSPTGNKGFANSTQMIDFNPRVFAKRLQEGGIGQYGRDPNQLAALLRSVPQIKGATVKDVEMITEAIKLAVGETYPDNLTAALEIIAKEQGKSTEKNAVGDKAAIFRQDTAFQGFPSVKNLTTPWGIPSFNAYKQPYPFHVKPELKKPEKVEAKPKLTPDTQLKLFDLQSAAKQAPIPPPFDPAKLFDLTKSADVFNALNVPVAVSATNFTNLLAPVESIVTNFGNLQTPTADTAQAFGDLIDPARQVPSSFRNVWTSATGLSVALDGVSSKISGWQPPASPSASPAGRRRALPGGVVLGHAVGGTVLSDGLIMAHAGNVITPARTTRGLPGFTELMAWARSKNDFQLPVERMSEMIFRSISDTERVRDSFPFTSGGNADAATKPYADFRTKDIVSFRPVFEPPVSPKSPFTYPALSEADVTSQINTGGAAGRDGKDSGQLAISGRQQAVNVTVNVAPPQITIIAKGDGKNVVPDLRAELDKHAKHIGQIVAREMANGRQRA